MITFDDRARGGSLHSFRSRSMGLCIGSSDDCRLSRQRIYDVAGDDLRSARSRELAADAARYRYVGRASQGCRNHRRKRPNSLEKRISIAVAREQHIGNENSNNSRRNQHPILGLETENREVSGQKLHVAHPLSCATYVFCRKKYIIFISLFGEL